MVNKDFQIIKARSLKKNSIVCWTGNLKKKYYIYFCQPSVGGFFQVNFRIKSLIQIINIHIFNLNLKNNFALFTMQVEKYFALSTILFIASFHPSSLIHVSFKTEKSFYLIFVWKYIYRLVSLQLQCSMKKTYIRYYPLQNWDSQWKSCFSTFHNPKQTKTFIYNI